MQLLTAYDNNPLILNETLINLPIPGLELEIWPLVGKILDGNRVTVTVVQKLSPRNSPWSVICNGNPEGHGNWAREPQYRPITLPVGALGIHLYHHYPKSREPDYSFGIPAMVETGSAYLNPTVSLVPSMEASPA